MADTRYPLQRALVMANHLAYWTLKQLENSNIIQRDIQTDSFSYIRD